ncbi:hypothetical protein DFA_11096 [Cavenderia fasciculata]|uniref:Cobalamin-independent methionine synthase MetE C-terminal/archaeal domain-containing protein n=1 Tax=Cavenderia fasciculata TaxID=261658 RepID=F4QES4_CACFS|nr:uncharacterized protein DFA_11096 [Cavenderia fasciculata]EGG13335.1 hypothetical protein DFA_11096 [Cavenderia fasciculata]|eukprot:XP_004350039.1 hypothetical protein DFA_11096 [Cavenderia fasciculata]
MSGIQTELIGSLPRPIGTTSQEQYLKVIVDELAKTGSPIITDGEIWKPSFATYPLDMNQFKPDGAVILFADGHTRRLPVFSANRLVFGQYSGSYVKKLRNCCQDTPIKQAVISPSAISLMYPTAGIPGYSREKFLDEVIDECEKDIQSAFKEGASVVQVDATELRLSLMLDPSGALLDQMVKLNNRLFDRFTDEERKKIGIHTCPGSDQDSTHSIIVDYGLLLPKFFKHNCGRFYLELAAEPDRERVLEIVSENLPATGIVFFGVIDPIEPRVETPEEVRDLVLQIARKIPVGRFGTCDDCGFSPFADDKSTSFDLCMAKIQSRVDGTKMASSQLGAK